MAKKHKRYALFIGRWQPFHHGHKYIIDQALAEGKDVAVGIRDTELSERNPYTVEQRTQMIKEVYGDTVKIQPLLDIESINIGRKVGYDVNRYDVPQDIEEISGTKIRESKSSSDVPDEVKSYISTISPTYWFVGLPCSGKSTLATELKEHLADNNRRVIHFDGDTLRDGLNQDLGFSAQDREENLRRSAYLAKMFNEQGNTVICSFITPLKDNRDMIKEIVPNVQFIYVNASVEKCIERDVKGMYKMAQEGKIKNFTGVDDPFEAPQDAIVADTENQTVEESLQTILDAITKS